MIVASILLLTALHGQAQNSPFSPPRATLHYAPDRTFDLLNISVDLDVDYENRGLVGHAVNTVAPLRSQLTQLQLMAGKALNITRVTVDGVDAP